MRSTAWWNAIKRVKLKYSNNNINVTAHTRNTLVYYVS